MIHSVTPTHENIAFLILFQCSFKLKIFLAMSVSRSLSTGTYVKPDHLILALNIQELGNQSN